VPENGTLQISCAGEMVCLCRIEGPVYAPQELFPIPTSKAVGAPCTEDLNLYQIKAVDDDLLVRR
jgi:hypothetical protein